MKRFHVHVSVADLDRSVAFYSGLFGAPPAVRKPDYAKWMVDDPRLNFAISQRGGVPGVNHLGLQAESEGELAAIRTAFAAADAGAVTDEPGATCCYARSDKHWLRDPQGIPWEGYHTLGQVAVFGAPATVDAPPAEDAERGRAASPAPRSACCSPPATTGSAVRAGCCS